MPRSGIAATRIFDASLFYLSGILIYQLFPLLLQSFHHYYLLLPSIRVHWLNLKYTFKYLAGKFMIFGYRILQCQPIMDNLYFPKEFETYDEKWRKENLNKCRRWKLLHFISFSELSLDGLAVSTSTLFGFHHVYGLNTKVLHRLRPTSLCFHMLIYFFIWQVCQVWIDCFQVLLQRVEKPK